jgi:hypothetical protein
MHIRRLQDGETLSKSHSAWDSGLGSYRVRGADGELQRRHLVAIIWHSHLKNYGEMAQGSNASFLSRSPPCMVGAMLACRPYTCGWVVL